jgi:integrase/recombinase XerD
VAGLDKQAKVLSEKNIEVALRYLTDPRQRAMFLLSVRAGLRAKEIASLTWSMVTDVDANLASEIALTNGASKGKHGGRVIPICHQLRAALEALPDRTGTVIAGRGAKPMTANAVTVWFHRLYADLGFRGASSHSGRRTAITRWARKIVEAGGSLKDVQQLAGHASLGTTQRYIDGSADAKRKVVEL